MKEGQPPVGRVVSVNVGQPRTLDWLGESVTTSIWKFPVAGRVAARGVNLAGDAQADRHAHGGPDKAVYSYAQEDADWWAWDLGRPLAPGSFGENLTLSGVDVTGAVVGELLAGPAGGLAGAMTAFTTYVVTATAVTAVRTRTLRTRSANRSQR